MPLPRGGRGSCCTWVDGDPAERVEFKRGLADANFVVLRYHQTWPRDEDYAGIDILGLDDNAKIVEHWDVLQAIAGTPPTQAHALGVPQADRRTGRLRWTRASCCFGTRRRKRTALGNAGEEERRGHRRLATVGEVTTGPLSSG